MQNSVVFKSVINSDSIFESIGQLGDFSKKTMDCEHICLFLVDERRRNTPSSFSINVNQAEMTQLQKIAVETEYFALAPDGSFLSVEGTGGTIKDALSITRFQSIYGVHIKQGATYGILIFCFTTVMRLTVDQMQMCKVIKLHMEQLVEKIQFRKHVLKRKPYENLFNTLRMKDSFTVDHSYNVAFYSALLGAKAGIGEAELEHLKLAALLHDIGKIAIPDPILLKPGRLTNEEFKVIRQHPLIGYELLRDLPDAHYLLPIVRWHHERMDGKGYPDALTGESIPLWVRIVSIADAFDAMTSTRVYRDSLQVHEVRDELLTHAGIQFDEHLVKIFLEMIEEHMKIYEI